ncbi:hypothetical protein J2X31_000161 [Flavobacterium arsenatis]|uniref:DUF4412 domain-containing protein n=1 Tax=Flavobacterium arsenatis TaxID=1484332 RepID=A0ABU1TJX4_9FLAO|nr:hypothetical protein [Flavobacterium arsenatis]MDR6966168.1 hypothetical protein [Flavobacterium arsenatis]
MNLKSILFFLLLSFSVFSQKQFEFDYMLIYDFKSDESSESEEMVFLTNSKDNSYNILLISKKENWSVSMNHKDFVSMPFELPKLQLESLKVLTLNCDLIRSTGDYNKEKIDKNYKFIDVEPVDIDGFLYETFALKLVDSKKEKKKKEPTFYYCIEKNTDFHLPILLNSVINVNYFEEKSVPNGIAKEMYLVSYVKKEKTSIFKLKDILKIHKTVLLPKDCEVYLNK